MSTCISSHGEFGSHELGNLHTCTLCGVLDEEALRAELAAEKAFAFEFFTANEGLGKALVEARAEVDRLHSLRLNLEQHLGEAQADLVEAKAELKATKDNRLISAIFGHHKGAPKPFALYRRSGRGVVALGAEFPDGAAALRLADDGGWTTTSEGGAEHYRKVDIEIVWLSDELESLSDMEQQRDRATAEAAQLAYERRLLGQCRRHLDEIADPEGRYTVDAVKTAGELAQRIVDEIGHSVTDEPALGPGFREEIVRLTADLTAETARANKAEANRAHLMDTCHAMALRIQDLEYGLDPKPLELLADARAELAEAKRENDEVWGLLKGARHAARRLNTVLVATADRLDVPFTNADGSPWTLTVKPAIERLQDALGMRGAWPSRAVGGLGVEQVARAEASAVIGRVVEALDDEGVSTLQVGHLTAGDLANIAFIDSVRSLNIDLPLDDEDAELAGLDQVEVRANAVQDENDRLHKLVDDIRQGDGHEVCRAELTEAKEELERQRDDIEKAREVIDSDAYRLATGVTCMPSQPASCGDFHNGGHCVRPRGVEQLAQLFHETYERLAPDFGYRTREASAKPWSEVPEANRGLMVATCREVLAVIERRVAADKRVLDAAKAWGTAWHDHIGYTYKPACMALLAAVDALVEVEDTPKPQDHAGAHRYLSTACHHGLHDKCRLMCKYCGVGCSCEHHKEPCQGCGGDNAATRWCPCGRGYCGHCECDCADWHTVAHEGHEGGYATCSMPDCVRLRAEACPVCQSLPIGHEGDCE